MVVVAVGMAGATEVDVGPSHDTGQGRGQEAPSHGIELRRVELWREPVPTVRLHTTAPIAGRVIALAADGDVPARLRIEVPAHAVPRVRKAIGGVGAVRRVLVERLRRDASVVTIELAAAVEHRVRRDGRLMTVELAEAARAEESTPPPIAAMPAHEPEPPAVPAPVAASPLRLATMVAAPDVGPEPPPMTPAEPVEQASAAAEPPPAGSAVAIAVERGARFVWPDLDAPWYGDPSTAVERLALKSWRRGATPAAPAVHASAAGRYLAADVTFLRTLTGQAEPLDGIAAYERAVRGAPGFPDAPRALVMIGFASLRLGLAPEAETAFGRALRDYPGGPYETVAALGRVTALRARRRFDEARAALAEVPEDVASGVRCDVQAERAALARATGAHADAVALDGTLARDCPALDRVPATLRDRADSLLALGRRADARALLARPVPDMDPESQATLLMRAADLARDDGDLHAARTVLDRTLGWRIGAVTRTAVSARLAQLDAVVSPDRAIAGLDAIAATAPTLAARADVLGLVAETLAESGRYEQGLARLAVPPGAGGEVVDAVLAHRDGVLARWIDRLATAGDPATLVLVYARHRTSVDTRASTTTARQVASALVRVRLLAPALRLLRLRDPGDDAAHGLAIAATALDGGDAAAARHALERLGDAALPDAAAAERTRLVARLLAAEGQPENVPEGTDAAADPVLARALAAAWMARGDAETSRDAWGAAASAYERAHTLAPDAPVRIAAAARLLGVRTRAGGPVEPLADSLAAVDDPVVRRAVELLAATRGFGVALAPVSATEAGDGR
jgi:tetratricopeptide (TPR) repeat protein